MTYQEELIALLCAKSFQYSPEPKFKLVSGRLSRFYVNCKPTTLSPRGMFLAGHLVFDAIKACGVQGVGGLTFGADPIAVATAFASELQQQPIQAFSIRKTRKDHGIIRWVEGDLQPGAPVAIIDDVATTGGSNPAHNFTVNDGTGDLVIRIDDDLVAAIGLDPATANGSLVFTAGPENTPDEADRVADALAPIVSRLREMSPLYNRKENDDADVQ